MTNPKSGRIRYVILALLFAISLGYRLRESADRLELLVHPAENVGHPFTIELPGVRVAFVARDAAAAGIQRGDVLLSFADRPYRGVLDVEVPLRTAHPGDRVNVEVRHADGTVTRTALELKPSGPQTTARTAAAQVVLNAVPLFCVLLGFWVAAMRIHDIRAWIFLWMMTSFAELNGGLVRTWLGHEDFFQPIGAAYQLFSSNVIGAAMLFFGVYFPERFALDRRFPWIKWILATPVLLRAAQIATEVALVGKHVEAAMTIDRLWTYSRVSITLQMLCFGAFFALIAHKTFADASRDGRRRLFLLYMGASVSMAPVLVIIIVNLVTGHPPLEKTPAFTAAAFLMSVGFPLTMAYVVVVERAMDVRVAIRQGLQYLLASKGIVALQIMLSMVVVLVSSLGFEELKRPDRIKVIAGGIFAILVIKKVAEALRTWVDRRFFREAYDAEQILSDLASKVRSIVETGPLLETVTHRISETLHIPRVAVLLPQNGAFALAYALGYPSSSSTAIPVDSPSVEKDVKTQLDAELVLPLSMSEKVVGLLSLGQKLSEEPYSKADIRLLGFVATQTGLALENSRLTEEIASAVAQRERLNREIEIAKEVQERLFPQDLPQFPRLEYAGTCRPALGVGGDYYDFIQLSETELGIAIGDVSGKGIAAALLMASLRASLRGQTIRRENDLAVLMANVNQLVYEGSTSNRYATFFYGQYDTTSRKLVYVNGGHNPPLIFREGSDLIRLETGGPVVGLLPSFPYQQGEVQLQSGDLFVAFTDGISEAMNPEQQEWGEDQLIECVRKCKGLNVTQTMAGIIAGADAFAAGAKQHDDMTIIVASLL